MSVERLYPLPGKQIAAYLSRFENVQEVRWVQDEPSNQGPWPFIALNLPPVLNEAMPEPVGADPGHPAASSAPAVGSAKVHEMQQRALMDAAFG